MTDWNWTAISAGAALLFGLVNLVLLYSRLGHDIRLRRAEIAFKMVDAEYRRLEFVAPTTKKVTAFYPPAFYFEMYLPTVEEIYQTGTFDYEKFIRRYIDKKKEFHGVQKKTLQSSTSNQ